MRAFFNSLLGYFLTPWGIILMGALDSSLVFFLPLGIDFAVIILAARTHELFCLYAILATIGSLIVLSRRFPLTKFAHGDALRSMRRRAGQLCAEGARAWSGLRLCA